MYNVHVSTCIYMYLSTCNNISSGIVTQSQWEMSVGTPLPIQPDIHQQVFLQQCVKLWITWLRHSGSRVLTGIEQASGRDKKKTDLRQLRIIKPGQRHNLNATGNYSL